MVAFATQVKRRRGTEAQNDAFTGAEGEITVDLTNMTLRVHDGVTQGGFVVGGGAGRNIGDIFFTTRTEPSVNGAFEADGATYNTGDFAGAGSIGELLAGGKLPYVPLAEFATIVSTNGSCRCFGWDGGTEFRVPKLADVFIEAGVAASEGEFITAGLPDHNHKIIINTKWGSKNANNGPNWCGDDATSATNIAATSTNASASNPIYGNSDTVQPPAVRYRAMVQLANDATDEAVVVAGNVLSDISSIKQHIVVEFQAPTADNGYTWYRKYADSWVEQGGRALVPATNGLSSSSVNVTLPVPIATPEQATLSYNGMDSAGYYSNCENQASVTTTTVSIGRWNNSSAVAEARYYNWTLSGMSAQ